MKKLLLLLYICASFNGFATFQRLDLFIIESDTFPILTYIDDISNYSSFYDYDRKSGGFSTNCYRGYYAIFELKQDSLYLNSLIECVSEEKIPLDKLGGENPLFWNWYSNSIKLGLGKCLSFVGTASVFEENRILKFSNGILKSDSSFVDEQAVEEAVNFNKSQILKNLLKDSLNNHLGSHYLNYGLCKSETFHPCNEDYRFTLKPNGKIGRVHFYLEWPDSFRENLYGILHPSCLKKMKTALKEFDFSRFDLPNEDVVVILDAYCNQNQLEFFIDVWWDEKAFQYFRKKL